MRTFKNNGAQGGQRDAPGGRAERGEDCRRRLANELARAALLVMVPGGEGGARAAAEGVRDAMAAAVGSDGPI